MAKSGNIYFMQVSRHIFDEKYREMSDQARVFYFFLNELEQRYTNAKKASDGTSEHGIGKDAFFRSDEGIAKDLGWSLSKVKRAKKELTTVPELVKIKQIHFVNGEVELRKHITCYQIVRDHKKPKQSVKNEPVSNSIYGKSNDDEWQ